MGHEQHSRQPTLQAPVQSRFFEMTPESRLAYRYAQIFREALQRDEAHLGLLFEPEQGFPERLQGQLARLVCEFQKIVVMHDDHDGR